MGSQWQAQFFQTLLYAFSVSLSFQITVNRELWSEMDYQRAQHEIDQKPAAHISPAPKEMSLEKDSMFDLWNDQFAQSQRDAQEFAAKDRLNEKPFVVRPPKMPQTRQMDDPLVHSPGVQVSQKPLMVRWVFQPVRSFQSPQLHTATQGLQSYAASSSRRQTNHANDPLVYSPGVQVPQRPLTDFSGVLRNQFGGPPPQHPTATTTQRPQHHEANPYRRQPHQTNDPLVHSPGMQVPQRPLTDFSDVLRIQLGGPPPQHPTATTTQRPQHHEANPHRRQPHQTNDPLVHSPGMQVPQRPLTDFSDVLRIQLGGSPPQRPTATTTQRLQHHEANPHRRQPHQTNDPLVHSPGMQVPQRPLTDFSDVLRIQLGGSPPQRPTATTTQRLQHHEANPHRRQPHQTNDPLVHSPGMQVPQRPLTDFSDVLRIQLGGSPPQRPTATTTQRLQHHEANPHRRQPHQTNDPLVHSPGMQVPQRPLTDFSDVLRIQLGGSPPQRPTASTTHRPHLYELHPYRRRRDLMSHPLVQSPGVLVPQKPLKVDFPKPAMFSEWGNLPGQFDDGPQHQPKPQPSETEAPSWHSSQTWQRPLVQSSQEPQLTDTKTLPKDQKTELQQPVMPQSIHAVCGETSLQLTVKMDLLGTGDLIDPADITLGGCSPTVLDESQQELLFETALRECGGTAQLFEDVVVYTFSLIYTPRPIGESPILKTNDATVNIKCHYARFHNVSSNSLRSTWTPYQFSQLSGQVLDFSLRLMTDDWQYERPSTKYFLGDMINIEALVYADYHVPLRIFVEDCVAAVQPDMHSGTSYVLIEKHGCLSDSKLMASRSQFMPRVQDEKLQMQIEAFRFADESLDSFYITCILRAVLAAGTSDSSHKACHYNMENDRWNSADGNDGVCSCCNADQCPTRRAGAAEEINGRRVKLGPITVQEKTT
ncbi:uncharacterized protein LOC121697213 isoform X2 [Alosa sapidissima]|uniref:uncharacterized protein LOC121697213 isoform X2 n=1 Tax=Alosa sapidissima TaxID=34773 RepID=UPI001C08B477|nr:uncharacterized protein LOC121697213 isoform X2 [Alosa sapidissima]